MKVLVNFALVLVMILCFVNIASSHHAQGNVPRMEAPLPVMTSSEAPIIAAEANVVPVENLVIPAAAPAQETSGYFALLLEQLKSFFVPETNSTVAEPSASIVEEVVLA